MDQRKYVIYVDDDEDDLEIFTTTFFDFPEFKLLSFTNGAELLTYLKGKDPSIEICLIVLDINMPVLNGIDTLLRLKADSNYSTIPTVLYSTSGSPSDRRQAEFVNTEIVF